MPAKMDEILSLSDKYNIPVIEDSAESLGQSIKVNILVQLGR